MSFLSYFNFFGCYYDSFMLGDTILYYRENSYKYIITYISSYDSDITIYLGKIYDKINNLYDYKRFQYPTSCGKNAEYICKNLKMTGVKVGKIIITAWKKNKKEVDLRTIESIYGKIGITINSSYHSLVYLEIKIKDIHYYVAIETTSYTPYRLQFYIADNYSNFSTIIKERYQCNSFDISFECDKYWFNIANKSKISGGKSKKTRKSKKLIYNK